MTGRGWLVCVDPLKLGEFGRDRFDPMRFRWLLAEWGKRIHHVLGWEESQWFDAFLCWTAGEGEDPKKLTFEPLHFEGMERRSGLLPAWIEWVSRFNVALRDDNFIEATAYAAQAAAFYIPPFEDRVDFEHAHRGRSARKRKDEAEKRAALLKQNELERAAAPERIRREFCNQFRDVAGNPFRPVAADPAWFTPTVLAIGTAIYDDRAFDRLPILADALEEAGCTSADLLLHCRQPGDHVRGCWAVDLILGKE